MIQFDNLTFAYNGDTTTNVIFNDFTGELGTSSISVILGSSGTGKTTLFKLICNLLKPFSSNNPPILIDNMPPVQAIKAHHLAYLPQSFEPAHWLTVNENISLALEFSGFSSQERKKKTSKIIRDLKLSDYEQRKPHAISGGEQRRVSLAMLLSTKANVFLLDEPFVNLDAQHKSELYSFLINDWLKYNQQENGEQSKTTLLITHDLDEAVLLGEKIYILTGESSHNGFITMDNPMITERESIGLDNLRYKTEFKEFVEKIKNNLK